jgi:hypothetical protein
VTETLPARVGARLPATYEAAKQALAECTRVDECKDWADKAAALASYARQRDDQTLHNLAQRIQLRAIRRMGEVSKELGVEQPRDEFGRLARSGKTAKSAILRAAGISTSAAHRAERVASIPEDEFEAVVASAEPPTIRELATRRQSDADTGPAQQPVAACQALVRFAEFCRDTDPQALARAIDGKQAAALRNCVALADRWLDQFVVHLTA